MVQIVAVMLGLAGGIVAWFAANFYGRSLVLFFELRAWRMRRCCSRLT